MASEVKEYSTLNVTSIDEAGYREIMTSNLLADRPDLVELLLGVDALDPNVKDNLVKILSIDKGSKEAIIS